MKKFIILLFIAVSLSAVGCSEDQLKDAEKKVALAKKVVGGLATTVPVTAPYSAIILGLLGLATTVIAAVKGKKHKKRADNYSDAIESARQDGTDDQEIKVAVLERALDTDTKAHFNSTGSTRL